MYTLLSGLYKYIVQKEEYYIIILGLDNAGKTTFLEKIKSIFLGIPGLAPEKIAPTVGLNVGKIEYENSKINFWDLGGQKELQKLWKEYYNECHGIAFIVDSVDVERIEECKQTFENIISDDTIEGVPVLMLANKQDNPNALKVEEIKESFNKIAMYIGARDSTVLPISALTGKGVKEAIEWLILRMKRNKENRPPIYKS
ncbi:ARF/SAR protein [Piromyces finnis]|uniref:ARF/SAR protein n=1 Tax=Piromyces finnis TaxID=1754191 RepID=A0A1Y1VJD2_9FUNG|nr:ARF/SAR protein [Piromyces finnis]|eukprot:ORX57822.1 ARF/SAR protein [Piromyces finnis]